MMNKIDSNQNAKKWEINVSLSNVVGTVGGSGLGVRSFDISQMGSESQWLSLGLSFILGKVGCIFPDMPGSTG